MMKPEEFINCMLSYEVVAKVLEHFRHTIVWKANGLDTLLDIGCGPGKITYEQLIPFLPDTFERIVGCDISTEMIEYANLNYTHPKLNFYHFDIEAGGGHDEYDNDDAERNENYHNQFTAKLGGQLFDHVTAFFVFHFIKNQQAAMNNIYRLLKPAGDCLFITFGQLPVYDAYLKLSKIDKWKPYMYDVENYISIYHNEPFMREEFKWLLIRAGFNFTSVEIQSGKHTIDGLEKTRRIFKSINPMIDRVPTTELQTQFTDDIIKCMMSGGGATGGSGGFDDQATNNNVDFSDPNFKLTFSYTLIIAYGRKILRDRPKLRARRQTADMVL